MRECRKLFCLFPAALALSLAACATHAPEPQQQPPAVVEEDPRTAGIRALLAESAWRASNDLSRTTGYAGRRETQVVLPDEPASAMALLRGYGHARAVDALENDINRALGQAALAVLPALRARIGQLRVNDVDALLGSDAASATGLLCEEDRDAAYAAWITALDASLGQVGYATSLAILVAQYNDIPNLSDIATPEIRPALQAQGFAGLCLRIAAEEQRMRDEPHLRPAGPVSLLLAPPKAGPEMMDPAPCLAGQQGAANEESAALKAAPATRAARRQEAAAARALDALLAVAISNATAALARPGGFQRDDAMRIALPPAAQPVADALAAAGQPEPAQRLLANLNIAAEITAGRAEPLLRQALANTRFSRAVDTLRGEDAPATRLFRQQQEEALFVAFSALVNDSLRRTLARDSQQELVTAHYRLTGEKAGFELEPHVRRCLLHGFFLQIGEEERAARADPARYGLDKLFRAAR